MKKFPGKLDDRTMDLSPWSYEASFTGQGFQVELPEPIHADPADRIIIATALSLGATVVTKDGKILAYPHVKTPSLAS